MMPLAASSIAMTQTTYTNGVAAPENGVENCGLKNVETAGPMIAADITTAPTAPTALRRRPTFSAGESCMPQASSRPARPLSSGAGGVSRGLHRGDAPPVARCGKHRIRRVAHAVSRSAVLARLLRMAERFVDRDEVVARGCQPRRITVRAAGQHLVARERVALGFGVAVLEDQDTADA